MSPSEDQPILEHLVDFEQLAQPLLGGCSCHALHLGLGYNEQSDGSSDVYVCMYIIVSLFMIKSVFVVIKYRL